MVRYAAKGATGVGFCRPAFLQRIRWIGAGVLAASCGAVLSPATPAEVESPRPAAASPASKTAAEHPAAEVTIDNFSFTPAVLTVAPGTKVTWVNRDDIPHTVVSSGKQFRSPALDTDERFAYTFGKAGTYAYYCSVHPK